MSLNFSEIAYSHKNFIQNALKNFEQQLHPSIAEDAELVTRAMFSVRNQAIKLRSYSAFSQILICQIQDVRTTEVTISFTQQQMSCTCPQKKVCRHQLAVIFKLSQYSISLQDWLTKWRSKKTVQLQSLAAKRTPESWQHMADEILNYTLNDLHPTDTFLIASLVGNARQKLQIQRPFEKEWQDLFDLFMEVAIMQRFLAHAVKINLRLDNHYVQYFLEDSLYNMQSSMDALQKTTRLFAAEPFIDALQQMIHDILLLETGVTSFRLTLYLQFWTKLFNEQKRITEEVALLEKSTAPSDIDLQAVKALFYILLRATSSLERTLNELAPQNIESYIEVAHFSMHKGYREDAAIILKKVLPHLQAFIHEKLVPHLRPQITRKLNQLYEQIELSEPEQLTLFAAFGKYGIEAFSDYLLRQHRDAEWVALHQLYPSSISYLEQVGLKEVIARAPEVALPLYHYYAMEEVNQKSRQNYKQAVRIWRSMKSAAKKCGKLDYFENYMETIQQQYKRLRALQEEINKSNLLAS